MPPDKPLRTTRVCRARRRQANGRQCSAAAIVCNCRYSIMLPTQLEMLARVNRSRIHLAFAPRKLCAVCSGTKVLLVVLCADALERGHADRSSHHRRDHVLHVRRGLRVLNLLNLSVLHVHVKWKSRARRGHLHPYVVFKPNRVYMPASCASRARLVRCTQPSRTIARLRSRRWPTRWRAP